MVNRIAIFLAFSVAGCPVLADEPPLPEGAIARLGSAKPNATGHTGRVEQLAFLPDGSALLSAALDGRVILWDLKTRKELRSWKPPHRSLNWLAVSPDGKLVATAGINDGVIRLWQLDTLKEVRSMGLQTRCVGSLAFSPDGTTLAAGEVDIQVRPIRLFNVSTGKEVRQLAGHRGGIYTLNYMPDGQRLISTPEVGALGLDGEQAAAQIWTLSTGQSRLLDHVIDNAIGISPNSRNIAVVRQVPVTFRNVGTQLVLVEAASGQIRFTFAHHPCIRGSLLFSADGTYLATLGPVTSPTTDRLPGVYFWDTTIGSELRHFSVGGVNHFAISPNGKVLATGGDSGEIFLWDISEIRAKAPVSQASPDSLWAELDSEAPKAYQAIVGLGSQGEQAVKFLREKLKPAVAIDAKHVDRLLLDLESARFAVREKANAELTVVFERVEPALRERLKKTTSAEARKVISRLLGEIDSGWLTQSERLREVRAIEALERNDADAAKRLLQELAKGDPAARLTREAKTALKWKERMAPAKK